jgi:hypothetical protein
MKVRCKFTGCSRRDWVGHPPPPQPDPSLLAYIVQKPAPKKLGFFTNRRLPRSKLIEHEPEIFFKLNKFLEKNRKKSRKFKKKKRLERLKNFDNFEILKMLRHLFE